MVIFCCLHFFSSFSPFRSGVKYILKSFGGVVVYEIDEAAWPVQLRTPTALSVGQKYKTLDGQIEIEVLSSVPGGFTVAIQSNVPCPSGRPTTPCAEGQPKRHAKREGQLVPEGNHGRIAQEESPSSVGKEDLLKFAMQESLRMEADHTLHLNRR